MTEELKCLPHGNPALKKVFEKTNLNLCEDCVIELILQASELNFVDQFDWLLKELGWNHLIDNLKKKASIDNEDYLLNPTDEEDSKYIAKLVKKHNFYTKNNVNPSLSSILHMKPLENKSNGMLENLISLANTKGYDFRCCNKQFVRIETFRKHMQSKHGLDIIVKFRSGGYPHIVIKRFEQ